MHNVRAGSNPAFGTNKKIEIYSHQEEKAMKRKSSKSLALLFFVFVLTVFAFAQGVQEQYNEKLKEANEVVVKMKNPDITKQEYDELNAKYQQLQTEIASLKA